MFMSAAANSRPPPVLHEGAPGLGDPPSTPATGRPHFRRPTGSPRWPGCRTRRRWQQPDLVGFRAARQVADDDGRRARQAGARLLRQPAAVRSSTRCRSTWHVQPSPAKRSAAMARRHPGGEPVRARLREPLLERQSRLSQDHLLHLDRLLQAFFRALDATVGADRLRRRADGRPWLHAPKSARMRGLDAGRVASEKRSWGASTPIEGASAWRSSPASGPRPGGRPHLLAQKHLDLAAVTEAARAAFLQAEPASVAAATRAPADIAQPRRVTPPSMRWRSRWDRRTLGRRAGVAEGELDVHQQFHHHATARPTRTTPACAHPDVRPGLAGNRRAWTRASVADIAPTLSRLLGISPHHRRRRASCCPRPERRSLAAPADGTARRSENAPPGAGRCVSAALVVPRDGRPRPKWLTSSNRWRQRPQELRQPFGSLLGFRLGLGFFSAFAASAFSAWPWPWLPVRPGLGSLLGLASTGVAAVAATDAAGAAAFFVSTLVAAAAEAAP